MSRRKGFGLLALLIVLLGGAAYAQESEDRTLSPFFFVKTDDPTLDQLPLKSVAATVRIAGVIADVTIEQVYANAGGKPLEALYVFPASTRAAVYSMRMTVGDRTITAEIRQRDQARQEYEEAREHGQTASLLEQQRPNVFQMNIANILPRDTIKVEMKYTELLVSEEGVYEFVYPTVVGPRYSNVPFSEAKPWDLFVATPYTHQGEAPLYAFGIEVDVNAGVPVQGLECTSHAVVVEQMAPEHARVRLAPSETDGGNRDFILRYRLAGAQVAAGLLLYEGEAENFFLFMGQPPARVSEADIPPREYVFIMDVSGSMHGFPISVSKALLKDLVGGLRTTDWFNVLLFSGGSYVLSPTSVRATQANIDWAIQTIDNQTGGGGTELIRALERALALPRPDERVARTFVIATDGYVSFDTEALDVIREHLSEASMFAFGIGTAVNRFLIEGMARAGMGEPFIVTKEAEAEAASARFRQYVHAPVLTQIKLDNTGFDVYDTEPASVPDIFAERPVVIFGKWRGTPQGTLTLSGKAAHGDYAARIDVATVRPSEANAALRYLWARHQIATIGDYAGSRPGPDLVGKITQLGLTYHLLTAYTSFVAVDKVIRRDGTELVQVEQPLPLPQGVEDSALPGGASGGLLTLGAMSATGGKSYNSTSTDAATLTGPGSRANLFGKTFRLVDGVWVDGDYRLGMLVYEYAKGSGLPQDLARFAELKQDMVVVVAGRAYRLRGSESDDAPALIQNAPNPFNAGTTIGFILKGQAWPMPVELAIYDVAGRRVRTYRLSISTPGLYTIGWDGRDDRGRSLSSGTYLYRVSTPKHIRTGRMIMVR